MNKIIYLVLVLNCSTAFSQQNSLLFNYEDFIKIVKTHHPITYQANLQIESGEAKLLKAKGGFDPKLNGTAQQKYYDDKQYYSHLNAGLKIPTWFGVTMQGGYSTNDGYYLNPESLTPENGLWHAGLSINLGKGLLIDERRAEIKQAQIYKSSTLLIQQLMLNQLVFDASMIYWKWFKAYNKVLVYKNSVKNAEDRFVGIKSNALIGEKPMIDTLKAAIQLQNAQINLNQSELELANSKVLLETFLWQEGQIPLIMDSTVRPNNFINLNTTNPLQFKIEGIDSLIENHPEILYYNNNIDIAKIDYRLTKENVKPTLELKYNTLSSPNNQSVLGTFSPENYNWGATVSYPILTRKERGQMKLTELKIQEQESQQIDKKASIKYKLVSSHNTWRMASQQVLIYKETVENYQLLFNSELTLFNIGESSVFLVNYREQELIKAQLNLIELLFVNYMSRANYNYQTVNT